MLIHYNSKSFFLIDSSCFVTSIKLLKIKQKYIIFYCLCLSTKKNLNFYK